MQDALELMRRDIGEAPLLVLVLLAPVVLATVALRLGSRLALTCYAILALQIGVWFMYYQRSAPNPGLGLAIVVAVLLTFVNLVVASVAIKTAIGSHRSAA